ncbi:MAG: hypothetical protein R3C24_12180 [Cyanobacteriota/Melainabacteria group bacterium]
MNRSKKGISAWVTVPVGAGTRYAYKSEPVSMTILLTSRAAASRSLDGGFLF